MRFEKSISNRGDRRGFSLVELMVVIVIIGLLAGVATVAVRGYLIRGRQGAARMEIANIMQGLETYYAIHGRYPSLREGLAALKEPAEGFEAGIITTELVDPWGNPYEYSVPGPEGLPYLVVCYGADGREGGTGENADITSADLKRREAR